MKKLLKGVEGVFLPLTYRQGEVEEI